MPGVCRLLLGLGFSLLVNTATAETLVIAASLSESALSRPIEQRLRLAYQQLGYTITVVRLPAGRSLKMANQGIYDGELFRIGGLTAQYPNLLQVKVPLIQLELHAYTCCIDEQNNRLFLSNDWPNEPKLVVGHVRGFRLAEQFPIAGKRVRTTTLEQAVALLRQHKIDVLLEEQWSIRQHPGLRQLPEVLASADLYHYLHQRHAELLPALELQLQQLSDAKKIPD